MDDLSTLLARLARCFPDRAPLAITPSAGPEAWASVAARFTGGHAQRWFSATDGQRDALPMYDCHRLCSLRDAREAVRIADEIRAEPDGYWVEPHWIAIASDGAGQHLMIDDRDGRVLAVAHDDDAVAVLGASPEEWLEGLLRAHEAGTVVWDETFGLVEQRVLDGVASYRAAQAQRQADAAPTARQKVGLVLTLALALGLVGLLVWWLESHR